MKFKGTPRPLAVLILMSTLGLLTPTSVSSESHRHDPRTAEYAPTKGITGSTLATVESSPQPTTGTISERTENKGANSSTEMAAQVAAEEVSAGRLAFYAEMPLVGRVLIALHKSDDSHNARVETRSALAARSGATPEVFEFVDFIGTEDDTPVNPGGTLGSCSMGAWGYRTWGTLNVPILVTAGHCSDSLQHEGHPPWYDTDVEWDATNADVQSMVPRYGFGEVSTDVDGTGDLIGLGINNGPFDRNLDPVCKSGKTTGFTCGLIMSTNGGCAGHTGMRLATYDRAGGDSGGPVVSATYPDVALLGFHSGACTFGWRGETLIWARYTWYQVAAFYLSINGWYVS